MTPLTERAKVLITECRLVGAPRNMIEGANGNETILEFLLYEWQWPSYPHHQACWNDPREKPEYAHPHFIVQYIERQQKEGLWPKSNL